MGLFTTKSRTEGATEPAKLLIVDHEKVERIFAELQSSESVAERQGLVAQLDYELTRHTDIEEAVLYPFVRTHLSGGVPLVSEANEEHDEAKQLLAKVVVLDPSTDAFDSALKDLQKAVEHHVKEEESEMFPKMAEQMTEDDLEALRDELEVAKLEETAAATGTPARGLRSGGREKPRGTRSTGPSSRKRDASVWVQPHHTGDGRWQVRRDNATRASRVFDTQGDAEQFGRQLAKREKVEFVLTGRDGSIREKNSYGNDPRSTPG